MILRALLWLIRRHPDVAACNVITYSELDRVYASYLERRDVQVSQ